MNNSLLLTYLCERAEAVAAEVSSPAVTADHFMIAHLRAMSDDAAGNIPPEIRKIEVGFEFLKLKTFFSTYKIIYMDAAEAIISAIKSDTYDGSLDSFVYKKIKYTADAEAIITCSDEVNTLSYLEHIFKDPTEAIKMHILAFYSEEKSESLAEEEAKPE